jgi:GDP-D-mannose 3', 5'-epimerase
MNKNDKILITGAGGFIGGHLVKNLLDLGFTDIKAVDIKPLSEWFQLFDSTEKLSADLQSYEMCLKATQNVKNVFNLACDMGGMGFIENNKAKCMLSVLINTNLLKAGQVNSIKRFFYSSSACVYNDIKQRDEGISGLKEEDAYPAMPEDGYGWEKLFSERLCRHYNEDFNIITRVARYHNVYGPNGSYDGGREKAPAAICRKVIESKLANSNEIEIWGSGNQTRSFMFIDDCLDGSLKIMNSGDITFPINLGSSEKVSINQLVDVVEGIAGISLKRKYILDAPKGVNGRNSDNTLIKKYLNWEPTTSLLHGMEITYKWIYDQMKSKS